MATGFGFTVTNGVTIDGVVLSMLEGYNPGSGVSSVTEIALTIYFSTGGGSGVVTRTATVAGRVATVGGQVVGSY